MGKRFNPDEFLAGVAGTTNQTPVTPDTKVAGQAPSKPASTQIPQANVKVKFNPDAFLAQSGTAVRAPGELEPAVMGDKYSTLEAFTEGAKQGATLGFQEEGEAALTAVAESLREAFTGASTLAPGEGIGAKYQKERDRLRGRIEDINKESPYVMLTGQLLGGGPLAAGTGGTGLVRNIAASAAQAGATAVGEADKLDAETAGKVGSSALFAAGLSGILGAGGKVLVKKGGDLLVKNGKKSFTIGKELQKSFTDEDLQRKIATKMVSTPKELNELVAATKQAVGQEKGKILQEFGEMPVSVNITEAFGDAFDSIYKMDVRVDRKLGRAKKAALQDLFNMKKSIMESGKEISEGVYELPLKAVDDLQGQMKNVIYTQGVYKRFPLLNGKLKGAERGLNKAVVAADEATGSGQLKDLNKAFVALFDMEGKKLSPASVKGISDPQNTTALKQFTEFFEEFDQVPTAIKEKYMPTVSNYVAKDLPDTVTKAQIMRLVTGRDPTSGVSTGDFQRAAAVQMATGNPFAAAIAVSPASLRAEAVNKLGAAVGQAGEVLGQTGRTAVEGAALLGQGAGRAATIQGSAALGQDNPINLGQQP